MRYAAYSTVLAGLAALHAPRAVYRRLAHGVPVRARERLGLGLAPAAAGAAGWVHAVSVGEALAAVPLVEGLARMCPGQPLVVTTVTETGARVVRERLGAVATHRFFPLDLPGPVRRIVDRIDPRFLVCMEAELWPNTLRLLARRGVPVMLASGRLSDRSYRRYRLVRGLLRPVLDGLRVLAMQSGVDARRVIALGARRERVFVTGNLKHDARPERDGGAELWRRLLGLEARERVWVAGSTHRGEEAMVLEAHRAACRAGTAVVLVVAPRHPERTDEVLALARAAGWRAARRSALPQAAGEHDGVIVLDTVGELARLYAVADAVFVGGSLVPAGGHNVLEPALWGKPVLVGPHAVNFREAVALLVEARGATVVGDATALAAALGRLLGDERLRVTMGERALGAAASRQGAVQATLDLVARYLLPASAAP